jgi:TfoX/Sxy family transcriptional regulator of competence genes
MAFDDALAARIRDVLADRPDVTERRMFGGLAFMVRGHMTVCAASSGRLMVRLEPDDAARLVATTDAEPVQMRGRPMKAWVDVPPGALRTDAALTEWVARGVRCTDALPPKAPGRRS